MKFISTLLLLTVLLLPAVVFSEEVQELWGTWINTDYDGIEYLTASAKIVFDSDPNAFRKNLKSDIGEPHGSIGWYYNTPDTKTGHESTFAIDKKWTDSEGSVWYKINYYDYKFYTIDKLLIRISNTGSIMEMMFCGLQRHSVINPNSRDYSIFYRQE